MVQVLWSESTMRFDPRGFRWKSDLLDYIRVLRRESTRIVDAPED